MSNAPTIGYDPAANLINRVLFRLMDTRPGYCQAFPVSTLGLKPGDPLVTPDLTSPPEPMVSRYYIHSSFSFRCVAAQSLKYKFMRL